MQSEIFDHLTQTEQQRIVKAALEKACRIAVVGLSPVAARPSFGVTRYMIESGFEIFGVRPASPPEILSRPCVERLQDLHVAVDIIDVFRNSDAIPDLVTEIAKWLEVEPMKSRLREKRPVCLWLQEGISHPSAEQVAIDLGLLVISDRCILKEHARRPM